MAEDSSTHLKWPLPHSMKITRFIKTALLALAGGAALLAPPSRAALTLGQDDLILAFAVTDGSGNGSNDNLEIDLGDASLFYKPASASFVVGGSALNANLASIYGSASIPWYTRADLVWGIIGTTGPNSGSPDSTIPASTIWATRPETTPGTLSMPWPRKTTGAQNSAISFILPLQADNQGSFTSPSVTALPNSPVSADITASLGGSYSQTAELKSGGSFSGTFFTSTIDNTALIGSGGYSISDLYQIAPTSSAAKSTLLGSFKLSSAGVMTFVAATTATSGSVSTVVTGFQVIVPAATTTGTFSFTVVAVTGASGPAYSGTVGFTSDAGVSLPSPVALSSGSVVLTGSFSTPGSHSIVASDPTDSAVTGAGMTLASAPQTVVGFQVILPTTIASGSAFTFTVVAVTGTSGPAYSGTVQFASNDGSALLPSPVALASGSLVLTGTFLSIGTDSIIASDPTNAAVSGTGFSEVPALTVTGFNVSLPSAVTTGTPVVFTVTALGAGAPTYSGTLLFASDASVTFLKNFSTLTGGTGSFFATFNATGSHSITLFQDGSVDIVGSATTEASAPRLAAGSYDAVFDNAAPRNTNEGYFAATLNNEGVVSGTINLAGVKIPLSGSFNSAGVLQKTIVRANGQKPLTVTLKQDFAAASITGTVSDPTFSSGFSATIAASAASANVEAGRYTVAFEQGSTGATIPAGAGYAVMIVSGNGGVALSGKLADGSAFSSNTFLKSDGSFAVYSPLYSAVFPSAGSLVGQIELSDTGSVVHWFKPARPADGRYKTGFAANLKAVVSAYAAPAAGIRILSFSPTANNGKFAISGGGIPAAKAISKTITLTAANKITVLANGAAAVSVTINPVNGTFTGSFINPATPAIHTPTPFQGILLQNVSDNNPADSLGLGLGFFVGPATSGAVKLSGLPPIVF